MLWLSVLWNFTNVRTWDKNLLISYYEVYDKEAEDRYYQEKRNLEKEMQEKINDIIVELELGGNKETLEKMLAEI